jgi:hypothetical protein
MAVESWGKGNPDFYTVTQPTKSFVSALIQERWNFSLEITIPANTDTGILTIYAVPTGKQLNVTYWKSSSNTSGFKYGYFFNTGVFYGRMTIDMFESGSTGESGAYVWDAGELVQFRIINPLDEPGSAAARFCGTLTAVG